MVFFYEPKDETELTRVERILREAGIEYFLRPEPEQGLGPMRIFVAEEDVPLALELVER